MPDYPHLTLLRETPVTPRRPRPAPIRIPEPSNPRAFGQSLRTSLINARERTAHDVGGFDDRRLIKLSVDTQFSPEDLLKLSGGVEIVSQEDKAVVLAFATEAALAEFERRLTMLADGRQPTYRNILYALKGFDRWTEDDRRGWALRREGWPEQELFMLDVELWPVHAATQRDRMWQAFEQWLIEQHIQSLDSVKQSELLLYRVRTNGQQAELLLRNRDVRMVDLPPRWGLDIRALQLDLQDLPGIPAPAAESPRVAVLDSGIVQNHPLLAPALGDAQSYVPGLGPRGRAWTRHPGCRSRSLWGCCGVRRSASLRADVTIVQRTHIRRAE